MDICAGIYVWTCVWTCMCAIKNKKMAALRSLKFPCALSKYLLNIPRGYSTPCRALPEKYPSKKNKKYLRKTSVKREAKKKVGRGPTGPPVPRLYIAPSKTPLRKWHHQGTFRSVPNEIQKNHGIPKTPFNIYGKMPSEYLLNIF